MFSICIWILLFTCCLLKHIVVQNVTVETFQSNTSFDFDDCVCMLRMQTNKQLQMSCVIYFVYLRKFMILNYCCRLWLSVLLMLPSYTCSFVFTCLMKMSCCMSYKHYFSWLSFTYHAVTFLCIYVFYIWHIPFFFFSYFVCTFPGAFTVIPKTYEWIFLNVYILYL